MHPHQSTIFQHDAGDGDIAAVAASSAFSPRSSMPRQKNKKQSKKSFSAVLHKLKLKKDTDITVDAAAAFSPRPSPLSRTNSNKNHKNKGKGRFSALLHELKPKKNRGYCRRPRTDETEATATKMEIPRTKDLDLMGGECGRRSRRSCGGDSRRWEDVMVMVIVLGCVVVCGKVLAICFACVWWCCLRLDPSKSCPAWSGGSNRDRAGFRGGGLGV